MARQGLSGAWGIVLMALAPVAAGAQSVPLPMEKPSVSDEDGEGGLSHACLGNLETAGVLAARAADFAGDDQCVLDDPVALEAVGSHTGNVGLPARPTLECGFAAVFGDWLREVVNPVAASVLGSPVETVVTGPGHQCRSRAQGGLSEHGLGNAIDITAFRLADGRGVRIESLVDAEGAEREFLRAISASACGYFTTVLGPGSDADHSDHLHLDLAERQIAEYRICMPR